MRTDIHSIPLSHLTKIHPEFTAEFFDHLLKEAPAFGKAHKDYWLINNNLTLGSAVPTQFHQIFNVFLQLSRHKCNLLQITKN